MADEVTDLKIMQDKLNKIARDAMDALRHAERRDPEELKHSGHKTVEAGVLSTFRYYRKQMDDVLKEHLKKWPD